MRILFLSPRQCWPALSGAKLREYHFAKALGQRAPLTYLHFSDPGVPPLFHDDLPFCEQVVSIPKPKAYTPAKIVQGLIGRWPLPVLNYTSPLMTSEVSRLARKRQFDIVHLDSIHMAGYVEPLNGVWKSAPRVIYNWHNIESEAMRRYSETVPSPAKKLYAAYTQQRLAALEREILKTAFGHIVCSERERDQLLQLAPGARITVVENGVDTAYFSGRRPSAIRRHLVFVGLMNYYPNVEAAVSFARLIWPGVSEQFPNLSLRIVGASPTLAVLALKEIPGVEVTGTVPDVRPYYEDALAAIVPLRTGGGTRLKILEAMAAGIPVISTLLGAEGLSTAPEQNILIAAADDRESWLRQITRLVQSPQQFDSISASALNLVKSHYDWQILGSKLFDTYEEWLQKSG